MSNEPFRMSRPANRSAEGESESIRPEEKPETPGVHHDPKPAHARSTRRHIDEKPPKKTIVKYVIAAVVTGVIIALAAWVAVTATASKATGIDTSKYQAVFLTNGQVYFGKLEHFSNGYLRLKDVYYLQTQSEEGDSTNPQKTSSEQQSTTLIKLGKEIHSPEDEMVISEEQVLFYENLKKDGKVSQSIEQYKSKN